MTGKNLFKSCGRMVYPKCCRVCESTDNLQLIFTGGNDEILGMLRSIASSPIPMNENLPQHICLQCSVELNETYSFRSLYAITSTKMKNMLLTGRYVTEFRSDMKKLQDEDSITKKLYNNERDFSLKSEKSKEGINADVGESGANMADLINKCNCEVISEEENLARNSGSCYMETMPGHLGDKGGPNDEIQMVIVKQMTDSGAENKAREKCDKVCNTKINFIDGKKQISPTRQHGIGKQLFKTTDSESNAVNDSEYETYKPDDYHVINEVDPSFESQEAPKYLREKQSEVKNKTAMKGYKALHSYSKLHKCDQCGKTFTTLRRLKNHVAFHKNPDIYKCDKCGKSFTAQESLHKHKFLHSNLNKCGECGKSFASLGNLKEHVSLHSNPDRNTCVECGKSFTTSSGLNEHKASHSGRVECVECGKSFTKLRNLKAHQALHSNPELYKCNECGKSFARAQGLERHKFLHSNLKCDECGELFATFQTLKKHLALHLSVVLYKCNKCWKSFATASGLNQHKASHCGLVNKCDECGNSFTTLQNLKAHRALHSYSNRLVCEICGNAFKRSILLKEHMDWHSNPDLFKCDECEKSFSSALSLKQHKFSHSNRNKCDECGRSFSRLRRLVEHRALHLNPERYRCDDCGKSFSNLRNLKRHLPSHSTTQP